MKRFVGVLCLLALNGVAFAQSKQTIPGAFETVEGANALNTMIRSQPRTLQMIISASELGYVWDGKITGLTFRLDGLETSAKPNFDISFSNYDIFLGEAAVTPSGINANFADNYTVGSRTQMRSGALTLNTGYFQQTSVTGPNDFPLVTIAFNSGSGEYHYTGGDLVIELRHTGNSASDFRLDATPVTTDYNAIAAVGYNAATDDGTNLSPALLRLMPIVQLQYTATLLPEPGSLALVAVGIAGLALARRRSAKP